MADTNNFSSRRSFLKSTARLSVSCPLAVKSASTLGLLGASHAMAASDDHKALVYIFLAGGNDSFNMLVPKGNSPLRTRYEEGRKAISLANNNLHSLNLQTPASIVDGTVESGFGLHPNCGDIAALFNQQSLSFICNVGTLVEPITREQYLNQSKAVPAQLFSHSDQQRQYQSSPKTPFSFGWGGRMAELLSQHNTSATVSPLISVSGLNTFQVSKEGDINTYVMGRDGATPLYRYRKERETLVSGAIAAINDDAHLMVQKYRDVFNSADTAYKIVDNAFVQAQANGVDYDAIFANAGADKTDIGRRLKTIAKMIAGRQSTGNNRPVYYVDMKGFDNHQNLLADHAVLMQDLNNAIKAFSEALTAQGDFDKTLTYIGSEFGRTLTPNGNDSESGTDHAWGGHALVMGGMVKGGHLFGQHPDLKLNDSIDASNGRGRWIPTTATSQCSAVIAQWFGVEKNNLNDLFPLLARFPDHNSADANLNFIKS